VALVQLSLALRNQTSSDDSAPGVGKHFPRKATLKRLSLQGTAYVTIVNFLYNFVYFSYNEGNNSHFRLSKIAVWEVTCGIKSLEF